MRALVFKSTALSTASVQRPKGRAIVPAEPALRQTQRVVPRVSSPDAAAATQQHKHNDAPDMFCYQCEQTLHGSGCTEVPAGVCGKTATVANLQDLLTFELKGLASYARFARTRGIDTAEVDSFFKAAVFSTLTNVNFDPERFRGYVLRADALTQGLRKRLGGAGPPAAAVPWFDSYHPVSFSIEAALGTATPTVEALELLAETVSLHHRKAVMGPEGATLLGLHELVAYGLRGVAAYAHHSEMLGAVDPALDDLYEETLAFLASPEAADAGAVLAAAMKLGEANFRTMKLLDGAHCSKFGNPAPTQVRLTPVEGKAILVSGHDLQDLSDLLEQIERTGADVKVYTHGEMLPAHGYPGLHKHEALVGNYGGAWYKQKAEFSAFPGPILMTTNCIMPPPASYADRIFTTGEVGVSGSPHLEGSPVAAGAAAQRKDFTPLIEAAKSMPGFSAADAAVEPKFVTTGFGHEATLGAAGLVLDAMKAGELKHIFLVGGCDAPEPSRKYYTEVVKGLPQDTMVLTLGCGKYRFYDQDLGTLPSGLPRLLDMGQCNDAYSAIVVASKLAEALGVSINELPLSLDISWFEQKAVAVLLTLLSLGVKNIRLGPNLPAFLTPGAVAYLQEAFNIMPRPRMMAAEGEVDNKNASVSSYKSSSAGSTAPSISLWCIRSHAAQAVGDELVQAQERRALGAHYRLAVVQAHGLPPRIDWRVALAAGRQYI